MIIFTIYFKINTVAYIPFKFDINTLKFLTKMLAKRIRIFFFFLLVDVKDFHFN